MVRRNVQRSNSDRLSGPAYLAAIIRNALAAVGLLLVVVTFSPVVKWGVMALEDQWGRDDAQVLVVLGGAMLVSGTGSHATLGEETYLRCVMAAWLYRDSHFRYVVVTGAGGLAQSMQRYLVENGVPADKILEETAARSTFENAIFTKRILEHIYSGHVPRLNVLTSDFHSRRARLTFQHVGLDASSIPAPDVIKNFSSKAYRWQGALTLLEETAKLAYYKLTGKV